MCLSAMHVVIPKGGSARGDEKTSHCSGLAVFAAADGRMPRRQRPGSRRISRSATLYSTVKPWRTTLLLLLLIWAIPVTAAAQPGKYVGRPVADVLRELQSDDLRIIFSSDIVPSSLRVKAEPKGRNPRDLAQQILAAHGLTLQKGPRDTWVVVARPSAPERPASPPRPPPPHPPAQPATDPSQPPGPVRIEEHVDVVDRLRETGGSATAYTLAPSAVRDAAGGFENVFQVLQVLPGAAGINDEDGKIAVRGGGPEHNLIVVDGIQIHRPQRLGDFMGSFVNPATIESIGLDASGFEARYGGRLSSVTTIDTRDGATDRRLAVSGSLGLTSGDALFEGRVPGTEAGSWWVTARGTYYRLLLDRLNKEVKPGFEDVQFKVTLRPSRETRLTLFGLAGRETMEQFASERGDADFEIARYRGDNSLGVMTLSWTPNTRTLAATTLSGYAHGESDRDSLFSFGLPPFERATRERDVGVRQRLVYAISPRHVVDAGIEIHRLRTGWRMHSVRQPEFWRGLGPSTWGEQIDYAAGPIDTALSRTQAGLWVQDRLPLGGRWTLEPGVRVDWNSYTGETSWQPRVRASTRFGGSLGWTGVSVQAQTPSHESMQGLDYFHLTQADGERLRNERSVQIVAGLERRLRDGLGLRVEGYHRVFDRLLVQRLESEPERALRLLAYEIPPDLPPDDVVLEHRPTVHPESTMRGKATGLEVLLRRDGRLSGWFAYTLSKATRELHGHEVPFDFDRRHALSTSAMFQLSRRVRLSGTWQLASGFPITPLHEEVSFGRLIDLRTGTVDPIARPSRDSDGSLRTLLSPFMRRLGLRNADRLSAYSRTDVRVTFSTLGRWEFYGEVINVFAERNYLVRVEFPPENGIPASVSRSNVYTELERIPTGGLRFRF